MDDIIRPPERRASGGRDFQRAYKACLSCRQKKAKCDIGNAPPCARCRREQRRCVFSEKRSWSRKNRSGRNLFPTKVNGDVGSNKHNIDSLSTSPVQTMDIPNHQRNIMAASNVGFQQSQSTPSDSIDFQSSSESNQLTNSLMRHVVSSGNDALNLLFEAAAHTNSTSNQVDVGRQPGVASGHGISQALSQSLSQSLPQACVTGTSPAAPPPIELSKTDTNVFGVWESFRAVRLGWFTAREAVTFVDR